jgi:hypothetical protein
MVPELDLAATDLDTNTFPHLRESVFSPDSRQGKDFRINS